MRTKASNGAPVFVFGQHRATGAPGPHMLQTALPGTLLKSAGYRQSEFGECVQSIPNIARSRAFAASHAVEDRGLR